MEDGRPAPASASVSSHSPKVRLRHCRKPRDELLFPFSNVIDEKGHTAHNLIRVVHYIIMTVGENVGSAKDPYDQSPTRPDQPDGKVESQPYSDRFAPLQYSFRPSSDDNVSIFSADNENERERGRLLAPPSLRDKSLSPAPPQPRSWRAKGNALWTANKGLLLVLASQLFGALMNVTTRLLETSENPLNTFQVRPRSLKYLPVDRDLTRSSRSCSHAWVSRYCWVAYTCGGHKSINFPWAPEMFEVYYSREASEVSLVVCIPLRPHVYV